jgi:predicted nucleic acid-binding Zn ribbon protein
MSSRTLRNDDIARDRRAAKQQGDTMNDYFLAPTTGSGIPAETPAWPGKFCLGCGSPIPRTKRYDSQFDSDKCKNRAKGQRRAERKDSK